jgi:hypothetical protein
LRREELGGGISEMRCDDRTFDIQCERRCQSGLRVRPMLGRYGAAAIVIAASGAVDGALIRFVGCRVGWLVTLVGGLAQAAGVSWRSGGRYRERHKRADQREQQQKSGGQALHIVSCESRLEGKVSIEQNCEQAQAEALSPTRNSHFSQKTREMGHPTHLEVRVEA